MRRLCLVLLVLLAASPPAIAQVIGQPTVLSAQSSSVCATTNAYAAFPIGNAASISFGITGTWSGTLTFKSSADGSTWVTTQVTNLGSGTTPVTTTTSNGQFGLSNTGLLSVCVDFTTRASGSATVTLTRGWSAKGGGATSSGAATVTGGTCTNQVTTAIDTSGVPTCTTVTSAYKDTSIASTGVDINTSYQVTATHLAAALPVAQGGTALTAGTSGGVLAYTASGTLASSGALAANAPVIGGGAGAVPSTITAGTTGQVLGGITGGVPAFKTYASTGMLNPTNPTATSSNTFVMMGIGGGTGAVTITPTAYGRVTGQICGTTFSDTIADGIFILPAYGTGTAPVNGAAATGTTIGVQYSISETAGSAAKPFCVVIEASGLTVSTAYWFDLQVHRAAAGSVTVRGLNAVVSEH